MTPPALRLHHDPTAAPLHATNFTQVPSCRASIPAGTPLSSLPPILPLRLGEAGGCSCLPTSPSPMAMALSPAGADPEETILNAFKVFDPEGKGLKSA